MTADGVHLKEPPIMLMMVIGMLFLKIEITYSVKAPDNTTITFNGTKEVSLSGTWEKNKNIRYILELPTDAKEVKLTPKVNTWENETNNNINDVKDVTK